MYLDTKEQKNVKYSRIAESVVSGGGQDSDLIIRKLSPDDMINYEQLQELIAKSHGANIERGIVYASATQSVEKLKQKIDGGKCYVAIENNQPIGTATICPKKIDYWYYTGTVGLIKLVAVDPDKKHMGIGTRLIESCIQDAKDMGIKVIVTDSAEENMAFKKLVTRMDFKTVDYCKYKANNFVSSVYALFFNENLIPTDSARNNYLEWKHSHIIEHN